MSPEDFLKIYLAEQEIIGIIFLIIISEIIIILGLIILNLIKKLFK